VLRAQGARRSPPSHYGVAGATHKRSSIQRAALRCWGTGRQFQPRRGSGDGRSPPSRAGHAGATIAEGKVGPAFPSSATIMPQTLSEGSPHAKRAAARRGAAPGAPARLASSRTWPVGAPGCSRDGFARGALRPGPTRALWPAMLNVGAAGGAGDPRERAMLGGAEAACSRDPGLADRPGTPNLRQTPPTEIGARRPRAAAGDLRG